MSGVCQTLLAPRPKLLRCPSLDAGSLIDSRIRFRVCTTSFTSSNMKYGNFPSCSCGRKSMWIHVAYLIIWMCSHHTPCSYTTWWLWLGLNHFQRPARKSCNWASKSASHEHPVHKVRVDEDTGYLSKKKCYSIFKFSLPNIYIHQN